jgi:hypothetical protein
LDKNEIGEWNEGRTTYELMFRDEVDRLAETLFQRVPSVAQSLRFDCGRIPSATRSDHFAKQRDRHDSSCPSWIPTAL